MIRLIDAYALIAELNDSHYPGAPYVDAGISIAIGKVCDAPTVHPDPCSVCRWKDEHPWSVCNGCKAEGVSE